MSNSSSSSPFDTNPATVPAPEDTSQHRYEDGRQFHNSESVAYVLPDDSKEDDRLHRQHMAIKLAFGSNFDAPVIQNLEDGINVLDSGCGPGTWTLEMATAFPNSNFFGTDISSRFPEQNKPGNCKFLVHNIVDEPSFEENYFGYIHQRLVSLAIKSVDWPKVFQNLTFTLKPGGWIELTEPFHWHLKNMGPLGQRTYDINLRMMEAAGLDSNLGSNLPTWLSDAGFTNVQSRPVDLPINHDGKVGELIWEDFKTTLLGLKPVYAKVHPEFQDPGVYEKFIDDFSEECRIYKSSAVWTRVIAQKPLASDI